MESIYRLCRKKWEGRLKKWKTKLEEVEKGIKNCRDRLEKWEEVRESEEVDRDRSMQSDRRNGYASSRRGSSYASIGSLGIEDRLSAREVNKIKKLVTDKEKEERKCNIAIKEMKLSIDMKVNREKVEFLIKDKLQVECKIISCRKSGEVVIAKIESKEKKKEIMQNKSKLKGGKIFIENDSSWEEKKIRERINRWAKEQREKREEVNIGYGRVKIRGIWKNWLDINQEEGNRKKNERRENEEKEREKKGDKEQNFV